MHECIKIYMGTIAYWKAINALNRTKVLPGKLMKV
jgi:hypothetical protein